MIVTLTNDQSDLDEKFHIILNKSKFDKLGLAKRFNIYFLVFSLVLGLAMDNLYNIKT